MPNAATFHLSDAERLHTETLTDRIAAEVLAHDGWLRFDRYMERALYEPGLGYYSAGAVKLGPAGDFTTAPELSELLAESLADFFAPQLASMATPCLLELGAGTGRLAEQLLSCLAARGLAGVRYLILEPSPDLRQRQQRLLANAPGQVIWLDRLPAEPIDAIFFGNEVADALPVAVFVKSGGGTRPLGVAFDGEQLLWALGGPDPELASAVQAIEAKRGEPLPDGYRSEVCLALRAWIATLCGCIRRGGLLLIDYGLPARDYYHSDRSAGTLICHYRHRAHADPFLVPGLQDITAWVDFSSAAEAGVETGMSLAGFTTQAQFLMTALARRGPEALQGLSAQQQSAMKTLLLPGEMGERFKLLWLTRGDDGGVALPGRDFRGWL